METDPETDVEIFFLRLPREERESIISHGVALRLSTLKKRLFLAESKVNRFEQQYQTTLSQLEAEGLPDGAGYEMHEDYIMWHHWAAVINKLKTDIVSLEKIARQGLFLEESAYAGY
jgi:hypothetical protein